MRIAAATLALFLSIGLGSAVAAPGEADDLIIVSVKPRSADSKPLIMTLSVKPEHRGSDSGPSVHTDSRRSDAPRQVHDRVTADAGSDEADSAGL